MQLNDACLKDSQQNCPQQTIKKIDFMNPLYNWQICHRVYSQLVGHRLVLYILIRGERNVFLGRKYHDGTYYIYASETVIKQSFSIVTVLNYSRHKEIHPTKFYKVLTESMSTRMVTSE